jgi:hypothetical protein
LIPAAAGAAIGAIAGALLCIFQAGDGELLQIMRTYLRIDSWLICIGITLIGLAGGSLGGLATDCIFYRWSNKRSSRRSGRE